MLWLEGTATTSGASVCGLRSHTVETTAAVAAAATATGAVDTVTEAVAMVTAVADTVTVAVAMVVPPLAAGVNKPLDQYRLLFMPSFVQYLKDYAFIWAGSLDDGCACQPLRRIVNELWPMSGLLHIHLPLSLLSVFLACRLHIYIADCVQLYDGTHTSDCK